MKAPDSELRRLTDAWHDGTISPADAARLEERLLNDPAARDYYLEISALEGNLPDAASASPATEAMPLRRPAPSWWKAAAIFTLGAFTGIIAWKESTSRTENTANQPGPEARITGMMGVTWNDEKPGARSLDLGRDMQATRIASGLLEVTFGSGTRVVIEGPADFKVTGSNAMNLSFGKAVADVPKGAEGFTIDFAEGRIVDLGTEFGVDVGEDGSGANFGVFRGEIEFRPKSDHERPIRLLENHAVVASPGQLQSVPFHQSRFTRKLPSRELAWEANSALSARGTETWTYDVTHLVWRPGRYRVICKWMTGSHGIQLRGAELLLDGVAVAADIHEGFAGHLPLTKANDFNLVVDQDKYHRGVWTLRLNVEPHWVKGDTSPLGGVVLVEDGLALGAGPQDFLGTWEYVHNGHVYQRVFLPDGGSRLLLEGKSYPTFEQSRWTVSDGCLELIIPDPQGPIIERHLLRNKDTLIFINQPYREATRVRK
jgi:hypothetical protein